MVRQFKDEAEIFINGQHEYVRYARLVGNRNVTHDDYVAQANKHRDFCEASFIKGFNFRRSSSITANETL